MTLPTAAPVVMKVPLVVVNGNGTNATFSPTTNGTEDYYCTPQVARQWNNFVGTSCGHIRLGATVGGFQRGHFVSRLDHRVVAK